MCKFSMLMKSCADVDIPKKCSSPALILVFGLIVVNVINRTSEGFGDFASG